MEHEAIDIDSINLEKDEKDQQEAESDGGSSFIDDTSFFDDQIASNYRLVKDSVFNFEDSAYPTAINVTIGPEEAMTLNRSQDLECEGNICNFVFDNDPFSETLEELDEVNITQSRIKIFEKILNQKLKKSKGNFLNALLWGAYFKLKPDNNLNGFV